MPAPDPINLHCICRHPQAPQCSACVRVNRVLSPPIAPPSTTPHLVAQDRDHAQYADQGASIACIRTPGSRVGWGDSSCKWTFQGRKSLSYSALNGACRVVLSAVQCGKAGGEGACIRYGDEGALRCFSLKCSGAQCSGAHAGAADACSGTCYKSQTQLSGGPEPNLEDKWCASQRGRKA